MLRPNVHWTIDAHTVRVINVIQAIQIDLNGNVPTFDRGDDKRPKIDNEINREKKTDDDLICVNFR